MSARAHTHTHHHTVFLSNRTNVQNTGSADRELARRTQSRNQVIYDVGGDGDRRLARSNSALVIRSRPSMDSPKPSS
jgi:hypothetical protein